MIKENANAKGQTLPQTPEAVAAFLFIRVLCNPLVIKIKEKF
jgi:hypothetical protein